MPGVIWDFIFVTQNLVKGQRRLVKLMPKCIGTDKDSNPVFIHSFILPYCRIGLRSCVLQLMPWIIQVGEGKTGIFKKQVNILTILSTAVHMLMLYEPVSVACTIYISLARCVYVFIMFLIINAYYLATQQ